jgi:biopolymer transport protein ExbD
VRYLRVVLSFLISSFMLASAPAQLATDAPGTFVLGVDRQGAYFLAGSGTPLDDAAVVAQAAAALSRAAGLVVEADQGAPYESVARAAVLLQQAGARQIGFRTRTTDQ